MAAISRRAALLSGSAANAARAIQDCAWRNSSSASTSTGFFSCTIPRRQRSYSAALLSLGFSAEHFVLRFDLLGLHCAADGKLQKLQLFDYGSGLLVHVSNILLPTRDIRLEKASHTLKQLGSNKRGCASVAGEERFSLQKRTHVRTAAIT
jgi:hypothetical protein